MTGRLYVPSDSTGALACKATRGPKPGTVMYVLYRQCAFSPVARGVFEMWIRAQHDSEEKDQLALLNKEADRLTRGQPVLSCLPPPSLHS